jgi:hypothetical protein
MQRLGYTRYVAQGGDWGNAVSEVMALQQPPGLFGIHIGDDHPVARRGQQRGDIDVAVNVVGPSIAK